MKASQLISQLQELAKEYGGDGGKEMTYLIKFYTKARGEVRERRVDAPNEQTAVKAICNYYGVSNDDIREIIELDRYDALRKEKEFLRKEFNIDMEDL